MNYIKSFAITSFKVSGCDYKLECIQSSEYLMIYFILEISEHPAEKKFGIDSNCDRTNGTWREELWHLLEIT